METLNTHARVPDGRLLAQQNELTVLKLVRDYGHVRRAEIERGVWPCASGAVARKSCQRTVKRCLDKKWLLERPNALGGLSLVLTTAGAQRLRDVDIVATSGYELSSVTGPQFFHRTLGTRYIIERAAVPGCQGFGEYALSKGFSLVARAEIAHRFGKIPDGLVVVPGASRGYASGLWAADWIEVESSYKPEAELQRIFAIAGHRRTWLNAEQTIALDGLVFVFDARQSVRRQLSWPLGDNYLGRRDGDGSGYFFALPFALPLAAALRR